MLLSIIMVIPAMSQTPLAKIDLGIKAGAGISSAANFKGDADSKTGYLAGLFMNYRENQLFSLQLELLYIIKGYKVNDAKVLKPQPDTIDFEAIFSYIEMPILARITAPMTGKYFPYLTAGGFAAYQVDSRFRLVQKIPFDFDLPSNEVDFGIIVGAGVDIKAGEGKMFFETRYDISLAKTIKNENHKLRLISFQFGYIW